MTEHTAKPWFYSPKTASIGCTAGWIVGTVWHDRKGDAEFGSVDADGNLIAAAPDLLEATEALVKIRGIYDEIGWSDGYLERLQSDELETALEAMRTAITKARGEG